MMSGFKYICFILLFLLFLCSGTYGQKTVISGNITDTESGEPIPYVNIGFMHSLVGTISETDGSFYLMTPKATDTLLVSSIGYEMVRLPIEIGKEQVFEIKLIPTSIALEAVVVTPGENPAFRILKEINKRKKQNDPSRLSSYQYRSYIKMRLDMNNVDEKFKDQRILKDFGFVFEYMDSSEVFNKNYLPLLITETVSSIYYSRNPPVNREVIEAFKVSGIENKTIAQFTGRMYQQLNIYDNFMQFFDPGFISPISDIGRMYYKYYLEDSAFIDSKWCYKIAFKPKRKQERTFHGFFWVADTSFAIKKYQLRVSADVNLNLLKDMIATYEYDQINDTTWFLTNEDMIIDFNVAEKSYGFFGRKTAVYDSISFDRPVPDSIRRITTDTYVLEDNIDRDDAFWQKNRKDTLTEEDSKVYTMVDSVKKVPMYKTLNSLITMLTNYYWIVGPVELGPYYTTYSSNVIEGPRVRIGGRTSNSFSTKIMLGGHVAYGFRDERFKFGLNLTYMFNTNPRRTTTVSYFHDIRQPTERCSRSAPPAFSSPGFSNRDSSAGLLVPGPLDHFSPLGPGPRCGCGSRRLALGPFPQEPAIRDGRRVRSFRGRRTAAGRPRGARRRRPFRRSACRSRLDPPRSADNPGPEPNAGDSGGRPPRSLGSSPSRQAASFAGPTRRVATLVVLLALVPLPYAAGEALASVPASAVSSESRLLARRVRGPEAGRVFAPAGQDPTLALRWKHAEGNAWGEGTVRRAAVALSGYTNLFHGIASASSASPIGDPRADRLLGAALAGGDAGPASSVS